MSDDREQKNAIFANQVAPDVDPRFQRVSQAEKARTDFGLEIPSELVPLPSAGKVYPVNSSMHNIEVVEIKAMTTKEEDILTSRALLKKGTVISELIKSCLSDKSINSLDLLSGDRNALMVAIRITGYGHEYSAELECPSCNNKSQHMFNLAELPIKRLEIEPCIPGHNLFEFTLPLSKKNIRFKFMTGRDEEEILQYAEKQKKLGLGAETNVTTSLLYSIVSIDGIEDRSKIANFVKHMSTRDSFALREYVKNNEPGISMRQDTTCNLCGHTEEVGMPLGANFLWPSAGR